jgi:hypothetical protein
MKTWIKALLGVMLSFMILCTCVGYAALTDTLRISGTANAEPPQGIFITSVENTAVSYGESVAATHIDFTTNVDTTVNIKYYGSSWNRKYGTVKYKMTVWNNTPYEYAYSGYDYVSSMPGYNGNQYLGRYLSVSVTDENGQSFVGDIINPDEKVVFYATYTISNTSIANRELKTLIHYKFGVNIDSVGDVAIDSALVRFSDILNDTSPGGAYETLTDKIDDKYDGEYDWKANFIGNVVDAHNEDTETINSLFQGKLALTIDGTVTNVTVLIKRENIDGDTSTGDDYVATAKGKSTYGYGCEMTLYMTTDELQGGNPVIYAAVFTCDRNDDGTYGKWYMIGDKYVGTASIVGYEGEYSTGSFDTGTWKSTGTTTYEVTSDYSYTVRSGQGISAIIAATDTKANSKLQTYLTQANDVLNGKYGSYAGAAIMNLQAAFDNAARAYTVNGDSVTVKSGQTRAELIPLIKELEQTLIPFRDIIG